MNPSIFRRLRVVAAAMLTAVLATSVQYAMADPQPGPGDATDSSAVTEQQDGWLIPWPAADDTSALAADIVAAGGLADARPADGEAENLDEALVAFRQARAARLAWKNAEKLLTVAEQKEVSALASANTLTRVALDRKEEADALAQQVSALVRQTYINGSAPEVGAFLTESEAEMRDALTGDDRVGGVLSFRIGEAKTAASVAVEAASDASRAVWEAQTIRGEVERLRALITEQKKIEKEARAVYDAFMEDQGAQVEIGPDGCPKEDVSGTLRRGAETVGAAKLCKKSVRQAATPQAALAIKYAFSKLGAPYACEGVGRMGAFRFDCSSLVSRAYSETVGIPLSGAGSWAHSTRDMMPWGGVQLDPHYVAVDPDKVRPGDLLLYRSCTSEPCNFQHVTMALADGYMLHTNSCGDVAHITKAPGYGPGSNFVIARRVTFLPGEEALIREMKRSPWLPPANLISRDDSNLFLNPGDLFTPDTTVDDTTTTGDSATTDEAPTEPTDDTAQPIPPVGRDTEA